MKRILILLSSSALLMCCGTPKNLPASGSSEKGTVNVGFGEVSKENLTTSVSNLKVTEKEATSYTNIFDYMRGRVPGVVVGHASAGTTPKIQVRGVSSVNSGTEPLILVDGIESQDISSLRPFDVYSIDVLKDASAAIYGLRGANGVILITTAMQHEREVQEAEERKAAKAAAREARKKK